VDYSLFMAVIMVLTPERVDKCPRATPIVFPPPIFARTTFVSMFQVSLLPLIAIVHGVYI
jgi:hypothetical protein